MSRVSDDYRAQVGAEEWLESCEATSEREAVPAEFGRRRIEPLRSEEDLPSDHFPSDRIGNSGAGLGARNAYSSVCRGRLAYESAGQLSSLRDRRSQEFVPWPL